MYGTVGDRVAEIGNALIHTGYPVWIEDDMLKCRAVAADFQPVNPHWIDYYDDENVVIIIKWGEDNIYRLDDTWGKNRKEPVYTDELDSALAAYNIRMERARYSEIKQHFLPVSDKLLARIRKIKGYSRTNRKNTKVYRYENGYIIRVDGKYNDLCIRFPHKEA